MKKSMIVLMCLALLGAGTVFAGEGCQSVCPRRTLMMFMNRVEQTLHAEQVRLSALTQTDAVQQGDWPGIKKLLSAGGDQRTSMLYWYCLPDGSYYTSEKDRVDANLKNRAYFPALEAGSNVVGSLIVGKTSNKKSAVVAVPIRNEQNKITGYLGSSIYLEPLRDVIVQSLNLPEGWVCFCLDREGVTALDTSDKNLILDQPLQQDVSLSLQKAVCVILGQAGGYVEYQWNDVSKRGMFDTGEFSGWHYVLTLPVPQACFTND